LIAAALDALGQLAVTSLAFWTSEVSLSIVALVLLVEFTSSGYKF